MVLLSPVTVLAISITPVVSVSNDGKISAEEDVSDKFRQEHALIPLPSPPVSLVANRCAPVSSPLRIYPGSLDFWKALEEPRSHGFRLQISTVFGVNTQSSCHTGHNHKSLCLLVTDGESSLAGR